jgi:hypothetical protein
LEAGPGALPRLFISLHNERRRLPTDASLSGTTTPGVQPIDSSLKTQPPPPPHPHPRQSIGARAVRRYWGQECERPKATAKKRAQDGDIEPQTRTAISRPRRDTRQLILSYPQSAGAPPHTPPATRIRDDDRARETGTTNDDAPARARQTDRRRIRRRSPPWNFRYCL